MKLVHTKSLNREQCSYDSINVPQNHSIDVGCKQHLNSTLSPHTEDQMDAILFLIEEYRRAYHIDPSVKSLPLIEFWKQEYAEQALNAKVDSGQLNPAFVADILSTQDTQYSESLATKHDLHMIKLLAKMSESQLLLLLAK